MKHLPFDHPPHRKPPKPTVKAELAKVLDHFNRATERLTSKEDLILIHRPLHQFLKETRVRLGGQTETRTTLFSSTLTGTLFCSLPAAWALFASLTCWAIEMLKRANRSPKRPTTVGSSRAGSTLVVAQCSRKESLTFRHPQFRHLYLGHWVQATTRGSSHD